MSLNPDLLHFPHTNLRLSHTPKPKPHFLFAFAKSQAFNSGCSCIFRVGNQKTRCRFTESENKESGNAGSGFQDVPGKRFGFVASTLPGGSWWSLSEHREDDVEAAEPTAAMLFLRRMWELVADERWVAFVAFGSLVIAAWSAKWLLWNFECDLGNRSNNSFAGFILASGIICLGDLFYFICNFPGLWPVAQETLSLIRIVRAYGTGKKEFGRYEQWLQRLAFINSRESVAYGFWNLSFNTLYRSTQIFAVLLGGMSVLSCSVTVEQLTKYVLYCEWLIYATWRVTNSLSSLLQSIGASEKIFQLMNLLPCDQFLAKGVKLQRLMGHIQFVNVSFHYPARIMMPALEHLNFSVEANQVIAIVGLSGSGKSTLLNLLLRLYEPSSGQIYIDGFPLKELDIRWLRQNIGYVSQEPHLFHMDIKSNIKYGCPRNIKQEDIERAAKQAYVHDFISSLPNGYETLVDDNSLSGGQKQRIAIARAILGDPVILILDEATSALDSESEHYIKEVLYALKEESKSRTIIIIAHRLSTVKAADRIFVMDDGRIIEMGNHEELLLKDGLYSKLNKFQADIFT